MANLDHLREDCLSKWKAIDTEQLSKRMSNYQGCEFADDVISAYGIDKDRYASSINVRLFTKNAKKSSLTINKKEELPCIHKYYFREYFSKQTLENVSNETFCVTHDPHLRSSHKPSGNLNKIPMTITMRNVLGYCTLRKNEAACRKHHVKFITPPKRVTRDGTHIYYWCDLQKKENCGKCVI